MKRGKVCSKCGETKPAYEFYPCKTARDGRQGSCKKCWKDACTVRLRGQKRKEWEKARWQRPEYRAYQRARAKAWKEVNRQKVLAHYAIRDAIRYGVMQRGVCAVCGSAKMVDAHHHDYSKPLDVTWLCRKHHGEEQRTRKDLT